MHSQINDIFDEICKVYGYSDDIIQYRDELLYVYDNEKQWRCKELLKVIKPKQWYIDVDGNIKLANKSS